MPWNEHCHRRYERPIQTTENPIRAFNPAWHPLYNGQYSDIVGACPGCGANRIKVPSRTAVVALDGERIDCGGIVIAVDGACRNNGQPDARAAYGVFHGEGSDENFSRIVPSNHPPTNQVAEIFAAIAALKKLQLALRPWDPDGRVACKVLIRSDSSYLVQGISEHIWKWKKNGYRTAKKQTVENWKLFQRLDELMMDFEMNHIPVWFWHVRREFNTEADALANSRMLGEEPPVGLRSSRLRFQRKTRIDDL
ncbi:ribonuclease h [Drepanopeziza brunnea f. sp. 'multigermtubi' MB_m1]|uniref:ribonuclease H n=1 Tax=Marssonina brunnea f. sp. multigermtubi (strain MB_m1) TaxID=1072389 RepID=K1WXG0_MARBU|nr:ribonuclease h [Drepanopeziza brunnea f. sp. 'multigermtubi' MB_m1]EKD13348.1 ribonuclease h [Drepanopeziza brunnea f. sp. 'multigermtubi' MB_m1]